MSKSTKSLLTYTALTATLAITGAAYVLNPLTHQPASAASLAAPNPAVAVEVSDPVVKTITEWDEFTGRFEAVDNVEIRARVSGYLTEISFEDGQIVEAGDLLFKIDQRPFKTALAAAKANLAGAQASLQNARKEAERGRRLLAKQALSGEEADRRERVLKQAEASLAAAKAAVDEAELNLEFTEIRAPIGGRISDDFVSKGNLIVGGANGGTVLTSIVSLSPIYFEFTASETDYLKYTRLQASGERASSRDTANPVRLKLADEDSFVHEGAMSFVDNQLDRSTATMRGRATFENKDGIFAPGMFGRIQLVGSGAYEAILVPDTAIQTDQASKFVWVNNNGVAARQTVTLGPIVDGLRVIKSGLTASNQLITAGTQFVSPGAELAPSNSNATQLASASTNASR